MKGIKLKKIEITPSRGPLQETRVSRLSEFQTWVTKARLCLSSLPPPVGTFTPRDRHGSEDIGLVATAGEPQLCTWCVSISRGRNAHFAEPEIVRVHRCVSPMTVAKFTSDIGCWWGMMTAAAPLLLERVTTYVGEGQTGLADGVS